METYSLEQLKDLFEYKEIATIDDGFIGTATILIKALKNHPYRFLLEKTPCKITRMNREFTLDFVCEDALDTSGQEWIIFNRCWVKGIRYETTQ